MTTDELELLAILSEERAEATLDVLRARFAVSQVASPQLVILRVRPEQMEQVQAMEGVEQVFAGEIPPEMLDRLDSTETLFAKAWASRQQAETKSRAGDGLDWDAEGFEPPDRSPGDWNE